jgi:nitroreductase
LDVLLAADNAIMQLAESGLDSFPYHFFVFIPVEDFID